MTRYKIAPNRFELSLPVNFASKFPVAVWSWNYLYE